MGFGVALIGYAFLLLNVVGGGLFAALILGYGFFLASRLDDGFLHAAISALFMAPHGILLLCITFGLFSAEEVQTVYFITLLLHLVAWMMTSYFWLSAVIRIARSNSAAKLETKARNRLVFTVLFLFSSAILLVAGLGGVLGNYAATVSAVLFIIQYAVIFINFFFLHTCFILITGERQYEKDKQQIAIERAKQLQKQQETKREVSKRIGKRK